MDIGQAKQDIVTWLTASVRQLRPTMDFAKAACLHNQFEVRAGTEPYWDLMHLDLNTLDVLILVYAPKDFNATEFEDLVDRANTGFLLGRDLIAWSTHPDASKTAPTNLEQWAAVFVQKKSTFDTHI